MVGEDERGRRVGHVDDSKVAVSGDWLGPLRGMKGVLRTSPLYGRSQAWAVYIMAHLESCRIGKSAMYSFALPLALT